MDSMSDETKQLLFSEFQEMPHDEFQKELQSVLASRDAFLENGLFDSSVFIFLDDVFEVMRDFLVYKSLPE